jgi:hypothetical protein
VSLGTLVAIVALIWLGVLAGLLRLVAVMERTERLITKVDGPGRSRGARGG